MRVSIVEAVRTHIRRLPVVVVLAAPAVASGCWEDVDIGSLVPPVDIGLEEEESASSLADDSHVEDTQEQNPAVVLALGVHLVLAVDSCLVVVDVMKEEKRRRTAEDQEFVVPELVAEGNCLVEDADQRWPGEMCKLVEGRLQGLPEHRLRIQWKLLEACVER